MGIGMQVFKQMLSMSKSRQQNGLSGDSPRKDPKNVRAHNSGPDQASLETLSITEQTLPSLS
jgi:hypothetical protein